LSHTILIADDNVGVRRSLRTFIEQYSAGDVCGEAENGAEAVEKVKQLHPDVVILDYSMPLLDGLRAAMQIRSLAPETKIILFTVYASKEMRNYAQMFGFDDVVPKSDDGIKQIASMLSADRK
jgi:DNA-binding NarL/FixJ family response regulator